MKRKKEMRDLIHSGFDEDNWYYVYDYLAKYHPDDSEGRVRQPSNDINRLKWYEKKAENVWDMKQGKMLEIGSHWGRLCLYKRMTTDMVIVGIDASQIKIDHTKKLIAKHRLKNITFYKSLAESLPFADSVFDVVYAFETLEHVGDLDKSLDNIRRVLKMGGSLIFSIPLRHYWDGGFHTQQHTRDYWEIKLQERFEIDKIFGIHRTEGIAEEEMIIGRVIKGE